MAEVGVDHRISTAILLAAGQTTTWFYSWWPFNEARFVRFDATPNAATAAGGGTPQIEVVRQWSERPAVGDVRYLVTYKNVGTTPVVFRPRYIIVPALRWGGGGSS